MIEIKNLRKTFSYKDAQNRKYNKVAVAGLSLNIKTGEIFGLLGPNGAGKTTVIRMLTMLSRPDSGEILYDNKCIDNMEAIRTIKQMIGVVPQDMNFDQDLTVEENMELHARLYHMNSNERKQRITELLESVELQNVVNVGVRQLSGGMKRRLLIARALIHKPKILYLDEPTVALDPQVRRQIWELIRKLAELGVTILITTHYIEEAEKLCDRVAIMNRGRLIAVDTPQNFIAQRGPFAVEWHDDARRELRLFDSREEAYHFIREADITASVRKTNLEDIFIKTTDQEEGL